MIEIGLFFVLGALAASFAALLVAPFVWRKAQRLALREYRATIPGTAREIRAEIDAVRAQAAVHGRRQEVLAGKMREQAARSRADAGRVTVENADLRTRNRVLDDRMSLLEDEIAETRVRLRASVDEANRLEGELGATQDDLDGRLAELDRLGARFKELAGIAEERKVEIVTLETRLERAADALRASERLIREAEEEAEGRRADIAELRAIAEDRRRNADGLEGRLVALTAQLADREETLARLRGGAGDARPDRTSAAVAAMAAALPPPVSARTPRPHDAAVEARSAGPVPGADGMADHVSAQAEPAAPTRRRTGRSNWGAAPADPDIVTPLASPPPEPGPRDGASPTPGARLLPFDPVAAMADLKRDLSSVELSEDEIEERDIRSRIDDIAARIVRLAATSDGPTSQIDQILAAPSGASSALAARIRETGGVGADAEAPAAQARRRGSRASALASNAAENSL